MKILYLGPDSPLIQFLIRLGEDLTVTQEPIGLDFIEHHRPDFIISYGYRHIIKKCVLDRFPGLAINLHIAFLPWNKGADPNFWSFFDGTPKGVTIHYLDERVDTGDIIVQKQVSFGMNETLSSSYDKLQMEIQNLFRENWLEIKSGRCPRIPQNEMGTCHKTKDKEEFLYLLTDGWNTQVSVVEKAGKTAA